MFSSLSAIMLRAAGVVGSLALSLSATAQVVAPTWQSATTLDDEARSAGVGAVDVAGNVYQLSFVVGTNSIGGTTLTSLNGGTDAVVAKYSPTGSLLWVRQLASPGYDQAFDIALDAAGNAYVTGRFGGGALTLGNNLSLPNPSGTSRTFVVRYSPQGTPEWA